MHAHEFEVIPAVDLLGDEAVRLEQGDFARVRVRRDPVELVRRFAAAGARRVHVVDLDGARRGVLRPEWIARLADAAAPAHIQASGGIRSVGDAERLLAAGADRVVVGTAAFARQDALRRYVGALGERLVVAIDVRGGKVTVAGWKREARLSAEEAAERCAAAGVARILATAIDQDGTLEGPDVELLASLRERSHLPVIAAGGIASEVDLEAVRAEGCEAAIVGRALVEGMLPLSILSASPPFAP